jgi:hypothetical protein
VRSVNLAKEELLKGKRDLEQQLKTIEEILANMEAVEKRSGYGQSLDALPVVKPDDFRGKRAGEAVEPYLRARRGFKIPLPRIVADLVEGGADKGENRGKVTDPAKLISHTLKLSLGNWSRFCDFHPKEHYKTAKGVDRVRVKKGTKDEDITVWLADAADQPKRRNRTS